MPDYNIVTADQACIGDDYTFPDGTTFAGLTASFSWTSHLTSVAGCDSTVLVNLEVLEGTEMSEFVEVCEGESFTFPDGTTQVVTQDFSYLSTLQSINGCDSIINTSITAKQSYLFTLMDEICSGDDYTFPDGSTQIGIQGSITHYSYFTTFDDCDSTIVTELAAIQPTESSQNISICQGDNFIFPDGSIVTNIMEDIEQQSTVTSEGGCDSIVTSFLTVLASYNQTENIGLCEGESILIGELLVDNINADTTITVNELTTFGCDSIFIYEIDVENLNQEVNVASATATATAIDVNYQWIDCSTNEAIVGANQQSFTPDQDGEYAVLLEGFACITQSECINITGTSTEDKIFSSSIDLYPNPTSEKLQFNFDNYQEEIQASIHDVNGKVVHHFEVNKSSVELNVDFLAPGIYITRFESEGKYALKKFVKI